MPHGLKTRATGQATPLEVFYQHMARREPPFQNHMWRPYVERPEPYRPRLGLGALRANRRAALVAPPGGPPASARGLRRERRATGRGREARPGRAFGEAVRPATAAG